MVSGALYDNLLRCDENAQIQQMLAESWEEDGLDVIFHLRKDVKGHDGTVFDADDMIFSMDTKILEPTNYFIMNCITSWEKVDSHTVKFTRANLYTNFYEMIASGYGVGLMVSKEAYETKGAEQFAKEPAGFGPYVLEKTETDACMGEALPTTTVGKGHTVMCRLYEN